MLYYCDWKNIQTLGLTSRTHKEKEEMFKILGREDEKNFLLKSEYEVDIEKSA